MIEIDCLTSNRRRRARAATLGAERAYSMAEHLRYTDTPAAVVWRHASHVRQRLRRKLVALDNTAMPHNTDKGQTRHVGRVIRGHMAATFADRKKRQAERAPKGSFARAAATMLALQALRLSHRIKHEHLLNMVVRNDLSLFPKGVTP